MNYDEYKMAVPLKASPEYFEVLLTIFQKLKSEIINYITKFEILGPTKHCHIITNSLTGHWTAHDKFCDQFKEIVKQTSSIPKDSSEDFDEESTNFLDLINLIMDLIKNMVFSMSFDLLLEDLDNLLTSDLVTRGRRKGPGNILQEYPHRLSQINGRSAISKHQQTALPCQE
ncbi:hypothetical protein NQ318_015856 [Aromia moschata]|uniref:Uncharacterized protein n=1 Tax=Aromia moschata TaxID=1265417 RepID=A0AAV8YNI6_9CUCU|nr:hypothetical protein NQ318_015856 [Aromia moschata]